MKWYSVILLVIFPYLVQAQFNLRTGYSLQYLSTQKIDPLFDQYNAMANPLNMPLSPTNFHHGITFGVLRKFGSFALDASLTTSFGNSEFRGSVLSANRNESWRSSLFSYAVSIEHQPGIVGYGASIGFQRLKLRANINGLQEKIDLYSQTEPAGTFYLSFLFKGQGVAMGIRPSVTIPLNAYNFDELNTSLFDPNTSSESIIDEDVVIFGLSVLIYNGPQN